MADSSKTKRTAEQIATAVREAAVRGRQNRSVDGLVFDVLTELGYEDAARIAWPEGGTKQVAS